METTNNIETIDNTSHNNGIENKEPSPNITSENPESSNNIPQNFSENLNLQENSESSPKTITQNSSENPNLQDVTTENIESSNNAAQNSETQSNNESGQVNNDITLHDIIESSHEQFPGKNVEVVALEADFSSPVHKISVFDEFKNIEVSGGNFLKGVKWYAYFLSNFNATISFILKSKMLKINII